MTYGPPPSNGREAMTAEIRIDLKLRLRDVQPILCARPLLNPQCNWSMTPRILACWIDEWRRDPHAVIEGLVTTRLCASRKKSLRSFAALPRHRIRQAPRRDTIQS